MLNSHCIYACFGCWKSGIEIFWSKLYFFTRKLNKITSVNSGMFTLYIDTLKHEFTP